MKELSALHRKRLLVSFDDSAEVTKEKCVVDLHALPHPPPFCFHDAFSAVPPSQSDADADAPNLKWLTSSTSI